MAATLILATEFLRWVGFFPHSLILCFPFVSSSMSVARVVGIFSAIWFLSLMKPFLSLFQFKSGRVCFGELIHLVILCVSYCTWTVCKLSLCGNKSSIFFGCIVYASIFTCSDLDYKGCFGFCLGGEKQQIFTMQKYFKWCLVDYTDKCGSILEWFRELQLISWSYKRLWNQGLTLVWVRLEGKVQDWFSFVCFLLQGWPSTIVDI